MMNRSKIKKGDEVIVIVGKDTYKRGKVLAIKKDTKTPKIKVVVDGVNIVKHHVKANPQIGEPGGIKNKEAAIDISNVMLYNADLKKGDRIGYKLLDTGKKARLFKKTAELVNVDG